MRALSGLALFFLGFAAGVVFCGWRLWEANVSYA